MKIICISDTHTLHEHIQFPAGVGKDDILIHAGDFTNIGSLADIHLFNKWLGKLPFLHKIVIAGNHDLSFEYNPTFTKSVLTNAIYLENSGATVAGLNIWGSPVTPRYHDWGFNVDRGTAIRRYWDAIPENVDILVTHGPPMKVLDKTLRGEDVGCEELKLVVEEIKPKMHVFGHIHESGGVKRTKDTLFVNASMVERFPRTVDEMGNLKIRDPIVIDWGLEC